MTIATLALAAMVTLALFAVPPLSPEALKNSSDVIVVGRVVNVTEATKSTSPGYADTVYSITLEVTASEKGGAKVGSTLEATTYRPAERPQGWAGPQGQHEIPAKGDSIRGYLRKSAGTQLEFLLPNGLVVVNPAATMPSTQPATQPTKKPAHD